MSSMIGKNIRISIFGQSHSKAIGIVMDGLPAGESIDLDKVNAFMARRRPGQGILTTARSEEDLPDIVSGLAGGKTCGAPLCALIANKDTHPQDYEQLKIHPRPGHADYTAWCKFGKSADYSGGGHFSGRLTAPLAFAGAVCLQILEKENIAVGAHIASVGDIQDQRFDPVNVTAAELKTVSAKAFPVCSDEAGKKMMELIQTVRAEKDSIGGTIECAATGIPAGIGSPMFDGIENRLAAALFGIPAVKGLEFGAGFEASRLKGSENNDAFYSLDGTVKTRTNHHGGILGGISSGMPILFRAAFKPTPSIGLPQNTVDLETGENTKLEITGRHDPCIVVRAVPVVEAVTAFTLLDMIMDK